jgi:Glycosyltransferase family 87
MQPEHTLPTATNVPAWMQRGFLGVALIVTLLVMMAFTALEFQLRGSNGEPIRLNDYDAYFVTGRLFWEGALNSAYDIQGMLEAQRRIAHSDNFTPWTYPPHFNLVVILLSLLPVVAGYLIWIGGTLTAFVLALRRLCGEHLVFLLLLLFPALLICVRNGQNGMFNGSLLIWFCLALQQGRASAGLPLAMLTVKPHLMPAIGIYLLLTRQWRVIGVAALAFAALLGLATAVFGLSIWASFQVGVSEAAGFLLRGAYPFYRMVSLYAALFRMGVVPELALLAQFGFGLAGIVALAFAWRAQWPPRHLLSAAIMASPMLSPYAYDYDLPLLTVALGLILPEIMARASAAQAYLLVGFGWLAAGSGLVVGPIYQGGGDTPELAHRAPSFGIFGVVALCLLALWIARPQVKN